MTLPSSLPDPDRAALDRCAELTSAIEASILAAPGQVIGFDQFMALALYTPGLGYYAAPQPIFGAAGDFVTAPESGELFGSCLAQQCVDVLSQCGGGITEYGAGSGALATTVLGALGPLVNASDFSYHIVEPSAELRDRQQQTLANALPELFNKLTWSAEHRAQAHTGVVLANEVLDALPAQRFMVRGDALVERGVGLEHGELVWRDGPSAAPAELSAALVGYAQGYCCEVVPGLDDWLAGIKNTLTRGALILSDYGYPQHEFLHPSRLDGTLKCHYQHQVHDDPFVLPGLQDITTSVNFTALAEHAQSLEFEVAGFTSQTRFLLNSGLETIMRDAAGDDVARTYTLAQESQALVVTGRNGTNL